MLLNGREAAVWEFQHSYGWSAFTWSHWYSFTSTEICFVFLLPSKFMLSEFHASSYHYWVTCRSVSTTHCTDLNWSYGLDSAAWPYRMTIWSLGRNFEWIETLMCLKKMSFRGFCTLVVWSLRATKLGCIVDLIWHLSVIGPVISATAIKEV